MKEQNPPHSLSNSKAKAGFKDKSLDTPILFILHMIWFETKRFIWQLSFVSRIGLKKWKKEKCDYATYGEMAMGFYNEAIIHLPFVLAIQNIWRAKQLVDMNYGTSRFRMRDSAKVAKILLDAGKGSQAESVYEAGPQSVTQVLYIDTIQIQTSPI